VLVFPNADNPDGPDRILTLLAKTIASPGNNCAMLSRGTVIVGLNPDHARVLHAAGYSREDIQRELWKRSTNPTAFLAPFRRVALSAAPVGEFTPAIGSPESVLVLVVGGSGVYSVVMPPWGGGAHENPFVSVEVVQYDACEVLIEAGSA
jgi:hypothetical protein